MLGAKGFLQLGHVKDRMDAAARRKLKTIGCLANSFQDEEGAIVLE
jgi:hypothetical protein